MTRRGTLLLAAVCLSFSALASSAFAAGNSPVFTPRIGNALGLAPTLNEHNFEPSENGIYTPVTYHGGVTMSGGVTVHVIFWAPSGYAFQGSPGTGIPSYEGMIQQFFNDVAHDNTGTSGAPCTSSSCNAFTVEPQYGWGTTPGNITAGANSISFNNLSSTFPTGYVSADDVIKDTDPYPTGKCSSPQDTKACITDAQLQAEVDKIVQATSGTPRGLHNLWYVFTPPDVDECISAGVCETTAYGGYHSLSNVGHGLTIYAYTGDPIVEVGGISSGQDPQGNPDAEVAVDIADHETNEAMSDPEGDGYMDPNGWEIGDKCEFGDQKGTPLGYAPDGSPYNQVINGHKYFIQEMWSNADNGCVQATSKAFGPLPLPQVNLTQFSPTVSGNTETKTGGVQVTVKLLRASAAGNPVAVASATATTAADGSWSATLSGGHTVGDDRDEIKVSYTGTGAPHNETILTGNGGNPFTESGWTGWTALDEGTALTNNDPTLNHGPSLSIAPCFQTGVLTYTGASGPEPATDFCGTASDAADVPLTSPVSRATAVTVSSNDNRAFAGSNLPGGGNGPGGLVSLTVPVGEPDSVSNFAGDLPGFTATGFPTCTANLGTQTASCSGLISGASYTLSDGSTVEHLTADKTGTVSKPMTLKGGDTLSLSNGSRTLTTLHVAHLKVDINGDATTVASGSCSPGEYWGAPLASAPTSTMAGEPTALFGGGALTGVICPVSGRAYGMPTSTIAQTDEASGGETVTQLADVANTSPLDGETMYGTFTAMAVASDGTSPIGLKITPAGGGAAVFSAANVATSSGVTVQGLKPGHYTATWTVTDPNGDLRRVTTHFIEQAGTQAPKGTRSPGGSSVVSPRVKCQVVGHKHRRIVCHAAFAKQAEVHGVLRMRIAEGRLVAALGHATVRSGAATVTMRQLRPLTGHSWWMTVVVHVGHQRTARTVRTRFLVI